MNFKNTHLSYILVLIVTMILALGTGCALLKSAADIQKPKLSVSNVQVTDFSFNDLELTYEVTVDNPNSLSVQMAAYEYEFKLNDKPLLDGRQDKKMKIKASDSSTFDVPMKLNFRDLYKGISTLANSYEAKYNFLSVLTFDLPVLGETEIPVSKEGTIPLLHTPKIIVQNVEVQNLSLTRADLVLNMEFDNPNALGLNVNNFNYDLTINCDRWAEGTALANTIIEEKGISNLQIPISLNIAEMGMSAYRLLTGSNQLNYSLNGNFDLGTTHPLLDQTDFTIGESGTVSLKTDN